MKKEFFKSNLNTKLITVLFDFDSFQFMNFICVIEKVFEINFSENIKYEDLNNIDKLILEIEKEICDRTL